MSNSPRLGLPYLDAAQAQKHVTMNEALARLDIVSAGRVETMGLGSPPVSPVEGEAHIVREGAGGEWSGHDKEAAVYLNGGWDFIAPWAGWQLWVASESGFAAFDGVSWHLVGQSAGKSGALTALRQIEIDHVIASGAISETSAFIPDKAIVLGVTARVITEIAGAVSWSLGVSGSPNRYGSGIGIAANAFVTGVTGSPIAYYGGSPLLLTSEGGSFTGGAVRIAVHYFEVSPPRPV